MADRKLVRPGTNRGEVDVDQAYFHDNADGTFDLAEGSHLRAWDTTDLAWVKVTVDHATGNLNVTSGGGGGAVTVADGADVAEGATTNAAVITDTTGTVSGKLRGLVKWAFERMPASLAQKTMANSFPVVIASDQSGVPVTGTFWQTTQPVQLAAETTKVIGTVNVSSGQTVGLAAGTQVIGHVIVDSGTLGSVTINGVPHVVIDSATIAALTDGTQRVGGTVIVDPSGVTSPVSVASLPLPSGAATDATALLAATRIRELTFDQWLAREESLFQ